MRRPSHAPARRPAQPNIPRAAHAPRAVRASWIPPVLPANAPSSRRGGGACDGQSLAGWLRCLACGALGCCRQRRAPGGVRAGRMLCGLHGRAEAATRGVRLAPSTRSGRREGVRVLRVRVRGRCGFGYSQTYRWVILQPRRLAGWSGLGLSSRTSVGVCGASVDFRCASAQLAQGIQTLVRPHWRAWRAWRGSGWRATWRVQRACTCRWLSSPLKLKCLISG